MQRLKRMIVVPPEIADAFWSMVDRREQSECWNWLRTRNPNGYGSLYFSGSSWMAHRVAFVLTNGNPSDLSLDIGHKCDNTSCCNPLHLEAITSKQNGQDAWHRIAFSRKGSQSHRAILSEADVIKIWAIRDTTGWGYTRISKATGFRLRLVKKVLDGDTWKHMQPK